MSDKPKTSILITGCSTGIGAYCALRLVENGYDVHATARRNVDIERLRSEGCKAYHLEHRDPDSIAKLFEDLMHATGSRLDAVFNNAGYAQPGAVEDLPVEALREQIEVNLFAYHEIMRRAVPVMRRQGHGRIVNCSSVLGRVVMPWRGAYNASKYALEGLSMTLRQELMGTGIHVSTIQPGPIPSNIMVNGAAYVEKHIDVEASPMREKFALRLEKLRASRPPEDLSGVEPVFRALQHALEAKRPRAHYPVTGQTHFAFLADRVLPKG
ncbi:MAG: SDR family NAD(P)-dependent oxidoreductase, partial [Pseudomonadota bacterium]